MSLGSRLRERRQQLGLTLEEVAQAVGVSKSTVQKWESGTIEDMRLAKAAGLAKALKVSPLWITLNQGVRGSSPRWGTNPKYGVFAFSGLTQAHAKIRRKHAEFVVVIYT